MPAVEAGAFCAVDAGFGGIVVVYVCEGWVKLWIDNKRVWMENKIEALPAYKP